MTAQFAKVVDNNEVPIVHAVIGEPTATYPVIQAVQVVVAAEYDLHPVTPV